MSELMMKNPIRRSFHLSCLKFAAAVIALCASIYAAADQNDPRLDSLFEQLAAASTQEAGDEITDQIWEIWREHESEQINALMRAGQEAMATGQLWQLERAVKMFQKIIELDPQFAEGWNKRATVYFFLGQFEASASDVRKTLELEPRHFGATAGLGLILLQLEYHADALKAFERALEINPHLTGPKLQIQRIKEILRNNQV